MAAKVVMKAVKTWNSRFCLHHGQQERSFEIESSTYDWLTEGQRIEGNGRKDHEDEDNPERGEYREPSVICQHGLHSPESTLANIAGLLVLGNGWNYGRERSHRSC